jgi:hypothetical protein
MFFSKKNCRNPNRRIWFALKIGLLIVYCYLSIFTNIAFDREYGDPGLYVYRDGANTAWRLLSQTLAASQNSFLYFYSINTIIFAAISYILMSHLRGHGLIFAFSYFAWLIMWLGLGQLRYGTAILIGTVGITIFTRMWSSFCLLVIASYFHIILVVGFPIVILFKFVKITPGVALSVLTSIVCLLINYNDIASVKLVEALGYSHYIGGLEGEMTSTWIKQLTLIILIWNSLPKTSPLRSQLIILGGTFVAIELNPLFAGRAYFVFLGLVIPKILSEKSLISSANMFFIGLFYWYEVIALIHADPPLLNY